MMDYEIFKAVVKENFFRYLPEEYRDAEIRIYPTKKEPYTGWPDSAAKGKYTGVSNSLYQ